MKIKTAARNAGIVLAMSAGMSAGGVPAFLVLDSALAPAPAHASVTSATRGYPTVAPGRVIATPFRMGRDHLCHRYQAGAYGVFTMITANGVRHAFVARCRRINPPGQPTAYAWDALPA